MLLYRRDGTGWREVDAISWFRAFRPPDADRWGPVRADPATMTGYVRSYGSSRSAGLRVGPEIPVALRLRDTSLVLAEEPGGPGPRRTAPDRP